MPERNKAGDVHAGGLIGGITAAGSSSRLLASSPYAKRQSPWKVPRESTRFAPALNERCVDLGSDVRDRIPRAHITTLDEHLSTRTEPAICTAEDVRETWR
jgi:hypothetical protein